MRTDFEKMASSFISCTPDDLDALDKRMKDLLDRWMKLKRLRELMVDFLMAEPHRHRWFGTDEDPEKPEPAEPVHEPRSVVVDGVTARRWRNSQFLMARRKYVVGLMVEGGLSVSEVMSAVGAPSTRHALFLLDHRWFEHGDGKWAVTAVAREELGVDKVES